jgi:hypothetical protein
VSILRSGFGALRLDPYALTTGKDKSLATAALSIAIVKESSASLLFRPVVNDTGSNDGMFHALVLAPRSRMELLRFLLAALFLGSGPRKKLPPFMGHIKTAALNVTSPRPLDYWHDGAWIQRSPSGVQITGAAPLMSVQSSTTDHGAVSGAAASCHESTDFHRPG